MVRPRSRTSRLPCRPFPSLDNTGVDTLARAMSTGLDELGAADETDPREIIIHFVEPHIQRSTRWPRRIENEPESVALQYSIVTQSAGLSKRAGIWPGRHPQFAGSDPHRVRATLVPRSSIGFGPRRARVAAANVLP